MYIYVNRVVVVSLVCKGVEVLEMLMPRIKGVNVRWMANIVGVMCEKSFVKSGDTRYAIRDARRAGNAGHVKFRTSQELLRLNRGRI